MDVLKSFPYTRNKTSHSELVSWETQSLLRAVSNTLTNSFKADQYVLERITAFYVLYPILTEYRFQHIIRRMSDLARDPKQIGNLIRRARKRRGLSQGALGAKAGLRQETVSLLETGNETAKLETILKVLSALDLELRIAPRSKGDLGIESDF